MPHGAAPPADDPFWRIQWPALRDGGSVKEIIWLDPDPIVEQGSLEDPQASNVAWWRRGDAEPRTSPPAKDIEFDGGLFALPEEESKNVPTPSGQPENHR